MVEHALGKKEDQVSCVNRIERTASFTGVFCCHRVNIYCTCKKCSCGVLSKNIQA